MPVPQRFAPLGGYGYMTGYPIGRMYADARVGRIYCGASEIMKAIIAESRGP